MERVLKDGELRPAKAADASAGRRQVRPLTDEEKQRQRERLMATKAEVKEEAMKYVGYFITKTMKKWGFNLQNGPFCYDEMQGDAVKVISWDCYCAIYYGERRWPEGLDLYKMMRGIAKSKMNHIVTSYSVRKSHLTVSMDNEDKPRSLEKDIDNATGFSMEMGMRSLGIEIAIRAVGNDAMFLLYLHALQKANNYDYMAEEMHMTVRGVLKIERKLLKYLNNL